MPPKKITVSELDTSSTSSESGVATAISNISMSDEQFRTLLSEFRNSASQNATSGNFAKCSSRFNGDDNADVDAFIDSIETYKECTNISNTNALRGLSMLLEGVAATWWQGIKGSVSDWESAISALKTAFSKQLLPHLIYREIFSREQNVNETTELFVCRLRALIAQLPYVLLEEAQIDMVYGLLSRKVRKRLPRSEITNFKDLLQRAREIELVVLGDTAITSSVNKTKQRCVYCKMFGHVKDECKKLLKKEDPHSNKVTNDVSKQKKSPASSVVKTGKVSIECYGCGMPNVIRSKCPNCTAGTVNANPITFWQTSVEELKLSSLPRLLLPISINVFDGAGYADTGAQISIAGVKLYRILQELGQNFTKTKLNISFADGKVRNEEALRTTVDVKIRRKIVKTTFIVLPNLTSNRTLLGVDFLKNANIVIDVANHSWYFAEDNTSRFSFIDETLIPKNVEICNINEYYLQEDEGVTLNNNEKHIINQLLRDNSDIFSPGGEPTTYAVHRIKTTTDTPIAVPPYPLSEPKKAYLRKELDRLLDTEIISECESPWASPIVMIPKKDGTYR